MTLLNFGQEYHSFMTKETKNRICTQIEFHPTLRAIFAVAYGERNEFDERVNRRSTVNESEPRFVLLWHLQEPIQPFLKMTAPEEVGYSALTEVNTFHNR